MKFLQWSLILALPFCALGQMTRTATLASAPLDTAEKLDYYVDKVFSPLSLLQDSAEISYAQLEDNPKEWKEGWHGFWRRSADNVGYDAIRNSFMFGLNSVSHADPRYFRMGEGNFFMRTGYAITQPLVGHADGGRRVAPWVRLAATFGVAFLSNEWYPDRIADTRHALLRGVYTLGTDATKSFTYEFWPDVKKMLFSHKSKSVNQPPDPVTPATSTSPAATDPSK